MHAFLACCISGVFPRSLKTKSKQQKDNKINKNRPGNNSTTETVLLISGRYQSKAKSSCSLLPWSLLLSWALLFLFVYVLLLKLGRLCICLLLVISGSWTLSLPCGAVLWLFSPEREPRSSLWWCNRTRGGCPDLGIHSKKKRNKTVEF